jgi:hypothetical protein
MSGSMLRNPRCSQLAFVALLFAGTTFANAADLLRPTFTSEVVAPDDKMLLPLLRAICGEGVRTVTAEGHRAFGCSNGSMDEILASGIRPRRYSWIPYALWQADGVIFGHFLSATSEDAAIGCFGCEGHPSLFGGTLLLTRKVGAWKPVWYKAGVITRHCRRVLLATGRQILFCEETDGGMGHSIHGLYTVDFTDPRFAWNSVVLMADSYSSLLIGGVQTQSIERVVFDQAAEGGLLIRIYARHGRINLPIDYPNEQLPKPKVSNYEVDFRLQGGRLKVTPETVSSAWLFDNQQ